MKNALIVAALLAAAAPALADCRFCDSKFWNFGERPARGAERVNDEPRTTVVVIQNFQRRDDGTKNHGHGARAPRERGRRAGR